MQNSEMKKFVANIILFVIILAVCDFAIGSFLKYWRANHSSGIVENMEYTYKKCNDDLLVFGSSRATHHYVPSIISDSLHMTCFNCGRDGMGILFHYGRWQMIRQHHKPKIILYDLTQNDYAQTDDKKYINELKPYCSVENMSALFDDIDKMEKFKLLSHLYQNNSQFFEIFFGQYMTNKMDRGYEPHYGTISKNHLLKDKDYTICSLKLKYLELFIQQAKADGVKLAFFISPYYIKDFSKYPPEVTALLDKYGIKYFDDSNIDGITSNGSLFTITKHLNHKGAEAYTRYIIPQIREVMQKQ